MEDKPEIVPSCEVYSFGDEIPDENRLTEEDLEKYIAPKYKDKHIADINNFLPFNFNAKVHNKNGFSIRDTSYYDNMSSLFSPNMHHVLEEHDKGVRAKEFKNALKKQKKKKVEQAKKDKLFGSTKLENAFRISFE